MTEPLFCKDCKMHPALEIQLDAVCKKIEQLEKVGNIKFEYLQQSTDIAKGEMERRLEGMNEFRAQLEKQSRDFISRDQVDLMIGKIELKIENLEGIAKERKGASKWEDHIITVLIGAAVLIIIWLMQHGIR